MSDAVFKLNQANATKKTIPAFRAGDTIVVNFLVTESNNRTRKQAFEGVVIAKKNGGINAAATVRKITAGVAVERVFPLHSPQVDSIVVKKRGKVRRAKIYYIKDLSGKKARIAERIVRKNKSAQPSTKQPANTKSSGTAKTKAPDTAQKENTTTS